MNKFQKILKKTNPARVIVFVLFTLWAGSLAFGICWAFIASLNTHDALMMRPMDWPEKLQFKNYVDAFTILQTGGTGLVEMLFNSLWFTFGRMIVTLAIDVMVGYALGNFQFKGRNFIFAGIIVVGLIPIYGTGSATLIMYMKLGMYDTPLYLFASASMLGGNTLIMMTFFQSLSPAYEEAARMDGAGYWNVFLKIHFPMVWPSVAALVLLTLIAGWNDATSPLYYLPSYPTLATGLYKYEKISTYGMNRPALFAGIIMCALPPMILFGTFREKLMTSVTIGGVK